MQLVEGSPWMIGTAEGGGQFVQDFGTDSCAG